MNPIDWIALFYFTVTMSLLVVAMVSGFCQAFAGLELGYFSEQAKFWDKVLNWSLYLAMWDVISAAGLFCGYMLYSLFT